MGMAGPSAAEWLNDVTKRAKLSDDKRTITTSVDDWGNLVSAAMLAYGIDEDELAALNDEFRPARKGSILRSKEDG